MLDRAYGGVVAKPGPVETLARVEVIDQLPQRPQRVQPTFVVRTAGIELVRQQIRDDSVGHGYRIRQAPRFRFSLEADPRQPQRGAEYGAVIPEVRPVLEAVVGGGPNHLLDVAHHLVANTRALGLGRVLEEQVVAQCERAQAHPRIRLVEVGLIVVRDESGEQLSLRHHCGIGGRRNVGEDSETGYGFHAEELSQQLRGRCRHVDDIDVAANEIECVVVVTTVQHLRSEGRDVALCEHEPGMMGTIERIAEDGLRRRGADPDRGRHEQREAQGGTTHGESRSVSSILPRLRKTVRVFCYSRTRALGRFVCQNLIEISVLYEANRLTAFRMNRDRHNPQWIYLPHREGNRFGARDL